MSYAPVTTNLLKVGDRVLAPNGDQGTVASIDGPGMAVAIHPLFGPIPVEAYQVVVHNDTTGADDEGVAAAEDAWMVKVAIDDEDLAREFPDA